MKFMKWKILIKTCIVCLLPVVLGVFLWEKLPDSLAIHFNINNQPDGFANKAFAVFGLPLLMVVLQIFCCFVNDINAKKYGERKKIETVTKWIIPAMTVILQIVTFGYNMGMNLDIRRIVSLIVGGVMIAIGNYMPKLNYIKNYNIEAQKARKINRFIGFESVIMGLLFIISIFFPPILTILCLILLIPYTVIGVIYGIKTGRK